METLDAIVDQLQRPLNTALSAMQDCVSTAGQYKTNTTPKGVELVLLKTVLAFMTFGYTTLSSVARSVQELTRKTR